jgi:dihydrofolate synthase/folylpolyglutamate synthase
MRRIDRWFVAPLPGPRSLSASGLREALERAGVPAAGIRECADLGAACVAAREAVGEADRIVVFGSFLTVAGALKADWR